MAKTTNQLKLNVKNKSGNWVNISMSPTLFYALDEVLKRGRIEIKAKQVIENIASNFNQNDAVNCGFSRLIQDNVILLFLEEKEKEAVLKKLAS